MGVVGNSKSVARMHNVMLTKHSSLLTSMESKVDCLVASSGKSCSTNLSNIRTNLYTVLDQPVRAVSAVISDEFLHLRDHMENIAKTRTDILRQVNCQSRMLQHTISGITNLLKYIQITNWSDARVAAANRHLHNFEEVLLMMPRTLQGIRRQVDKEGAMHIVVSEAIFNIWDVMEHAT